jgi:hypothetical protein
LMPTSSSIVCAGVWRGRALVAALCIAALPLTLAAAGRNDQALIKVTHDEKISADVENVPLSQVLDAMAASVGLEVKGSVPSGEMVSVNFSNLGLDEALKRLLLGYNYVLITSEQTGKASLMVMGRAERSKIVESVPPPESPPQTPVLPMARGRRVMDPSLQGPAAGVPPGQGQVPGAGPSPVALPPGMEQPDRMPMSPVPGGPTRPDAVPGRAEATDQRNVLQNDGQAFKPGELPVVSRGVPLNLMPPGTATGPSPMAGSSPSQLPGPGGLPSPLPGPGGLPSPPQGGEVSEPVPGSRPDASGTNPFPPK